MARRRDPWSNAEPFAEETTDIPARRGQGRKEAGENLATAGYLYNSRQEPPRQPDSTESHQAAQAACSRTSQAQTSRAGVAIALRFTIRQESALDRRPNSGRPFLIVLS